MLKLIVAPSDRRCSAARFPTTLASTVRTVCGPQSGERRLVISGESTSTGGWHNVLVNLRAVGQTTRQSRFRLLVRVVQVRVAPAVRVVPVGCRDVGPKLVCESVAARSATPLRNSCRRKSYPAGRARLEHRGRIARRGDAYIATDSLDRKARMGELSGHGRPGPSPMCRSRRTKLAGVGQRVICPAGADRRDNDCRGRVVCTYVRARSTWRSGGCRMRRPLACGDHSVDIAVAVMEETIVALHERSGRLLVPTSIDDATLRLEASIAAGRSARLDTGGRGCHI